MAWSCAPSRARAALRFLICGTVALLWLAPAATAAARAPRLPPGFFGINALALFAAPEASWSEQLSLMQRGGIKSVRSDADWSWAEPDAPAGATHSYRWSQFDAIVSALALHRLRWRPIVGYSAPWAASQPGNELSPPSSDAAFATYAGALASRYGARGSFWRSHPEVPYLPVRQWEIWNEENGGYFWQPAPDPARYIDLYLASRRAIRSVDPRAQVLVGGLVGDASTNAFIAGMYRHRPDARGQIDAIALHPYPQDPEESAASSMRLITGTRAFLDHLVRPRVPLEITEIGWSTQGPGAVSDATRALDLTQLIRGLTSSGLYVTSVVPYTWVSPPGPSGLLSLLLPRPAASYGMFNWDGSATLEGQAYLTLIRQLTPPSAARHRRHRHGRHRHAGHGHAGHRHAGHGHAGHGHAGHRHQRR